MRLLNHGLSRLEGKMYLLPDEHSMLVRSVVELVYLVDTVRGEVERGDWL